MKVVSPVVNDISDGIYSYEYYNDTPTCSASTGTYDYTYSDVAAFKAATGVTYNKDEYVAITSLKRVYRLAADTASYTDVPPAYPTKWTDYGATNDFRVFDSLMSSQTESAIDFTVSFDFNRINSFAALNCENITQIQIVQVDNSDTSTVIDETVSLRDYGVLSLYDYWYKPISDAKTYKNTDLVWLPDSTVTLTFTVAASSTGKVGAVVSGYLDDLGITLFGTSIGFRDFSTYSTDDYGNVSFKRRGVVDIIEGSVIIDNNNIDYVVSKLKDIRGKMSLFIGDERDDGFQSMTVLGYAEQTKFSIDNPKKTKYPLKIIGGL